MKEKKFINFLIITVFLTLGLSFSLKDLVAQWNGPINDPTQDNEPIFIDESSVDQEKNANLTIVSNIGTTGLFTADGGVGDETLWVRNDTDRLGIGTYDPQFKLHVKDGVSKIDEIFFIEQRTGDPLSPEVGRFWYRSDQGGMVLKGYDGSSIIQFAVEAPGSVSSDLRIARGGQIYGISLVAPADPDATKYRIIDSSNAEMALKKYTPPPPVYNWTNPAFTCACTNHRVRTIDCMLGATVVADSFCETNVGPKPAEVSTGCTLTMFDGEGNGYPTVWVENGAYGECWQASNMFSSVNWAGGAFVGNQRNCQGANCLYNFAAANVVCPQNNGWHLPSNAEWHALEMAFKNAPAACAHPRNDDWNVSPWPCNNAGTDLKVGGSSGLNLPLTGRWDPPGGSYVGFDRVGLDGYFWTSTSIDASNGKRYAVTGDATHPTSVPGVSQLTYPKDWGYAVRCIKD
jgi:uncharacterized protein (TIGR02145 family)